jgi:hypothetical protein
MKFCANDPEFGKLFVTDYDTGVEGDESVPPVSLETVLAAAEWA